MKPMRKITPQLVLGVNDKKNPVYIQEDNRKRHLLVLGTKGSGKSETVLPLLVKQDIEDKKVGATIFVGDKETALLMYSLARRNQRDVRIIKPSLTVTGEVLLSQKRYLYNDIKEHVVDFEQAIRKKEIVIVDLEFAIYQEKAIQATAYLLHAFREAYLQENLSKETTHYLYVDDSHLFIPYLMPIIMNGGEYGIGCTLFLETRQLLTYHERALIDSYIRNKMVLSGLTIEDAKYLADDIYERQLTYILNRDKVEFIYSTTEAKGRRTNGTGKLTPLDDELMASLRLSVPRHRGTILRNQESGGEEVEVEPESLSQTPPESLETVETEMQPEESTVSATPAVVEMPKPEHKKPNVQMPEQKQRERVKRQEKLSATISRETKRHVVILDNVFSDDEEF